ncbi:hypothetical protein YC2023_056632 [Brassica napus]
MVKLNSRRCKHSGVHGFRKKNLYPFPLQVSEEDDEDDKGSGEWSAALWGYRL